MTATDGLWQMTPGADLARAATGVDHVPVSRIGRACSVTTGRATSRPSSRRIPTHTGCPPAECAVPSDDLGRDRTVPSLAEKRREARARLHAVGSRTGGGGLRRGLQSPGGSRGAAERDAHRRVLRGTGHDPGPHQATHSAATETGEPTRGASRGHLLRSVSKKRPQLSRLAWRRTMQALIFHWHKTSGRPVPDGSYRSQVSASCCTETRFRRLSFGAVMRRPLTSSLWPF